MLKDDDMLALGMILLALGILVGKFTNYVASDFVEGLLMGLSLALNVAYMIMKRLGK